MLGSKLKQRRKELNLTLKEVSVAVGVAEATVQRWESGNIKMIKSDKLKALSQILQLPIEELSNWTSNIPSSQLEEWDNKYNPNNKLQKETKAFEQIKEILGDKACELMILFTQLNEQGKEKAIDTLSDLTAIDKYTNNGKEG